MPTVSILCSFNPEPRDYLQNMMHPGFRWNDFVFVPSSYPNPDFTLILNHPSARARYLPERSVVLQMEPPSVMKKEFPPPFGDGKDREKFLFFHDTATFHNVFDWHISPTWTQLSQGTVPLEKTKILSCVVSNKQTSETYRARVSFVYELARLLPMDIYGKGHAPDWIPEESPGKYRGQLPASKKDDALFGYKYSVGLENCSEPNYFTEKIVDCILSECLCFYWGCPNIEAFIDPRSYIRLDIADPEYSSRIIRTAIEQDEWAKRLPFIRAEKKRLLNELQIFPTFEQCIQRAAAPPHGSRHPAALPPFWMQRARWLLGRIAGRVKRQWLSFFR